MIYLIEGDMEGVAFSAVAFIPVIGQVSTPAKYLDDGAELAFKYGDDAAEALWHSDDAFRFTMGYSDDPLGLLFKESEANGNLLHYGDDFEGVSNPKTLFRGDRSTVTPDVVFENGFTPKGTHNDALLHTKSNATAGNFISTTDKFELARDGFAGKNGYVYVIETNNYVDINATYGAKAYFPEQFEFSVPGGIKPSEIKGAYAKQGGKIVGSLIKNSSYGGK